MSFISLAKAFVTIWCCFTTRMLAKSGASTWTSYIEPQPPLTSTTAISVALGNASARIFINCSSAAFWRLILVVLKYLVAGRDICKFGCCNVVDLGTESQNNSLRSGRPLFTAKALVNMKAMISKRQSHLDVITMNVCSAMLITHISQILYSVSAGFIVTTQHVIMVATPHLDLYQIYISLNIVHELCRLAIVTKTLFWLQTVTLQSTEYSHNQPWPWHPHTRDTAASERSSANFWLLAGWRARLAAAALSPLPASLWQWYGAFSNVSE